MVVIPNGTDVATFRPDPMARAAVRRELNLPEGAPLIGLVARFDPQKDPRNFVQAAARLHARRPEAQFLLCGHGMNWDNPALVRWIEGGGIRDRCYLLGRREDIPRLTAALDVATSSSATEGFPNVLGEAMACGVPCVATDVGDSAVIVGNTGHVVPPHTPGALADAWARLLDMPARERRDLGMRARERVASSFSIDSVVERYEALYRGLTSTSRECRISGEVRV
jgi:glycosyltransferase involved in cell wall biosynthesis